MSQDDGNVGDSDSIINQKKILMEYAEKNGYTPYKFYIDDGFSGTNFERPQFKQMIDDESAEVVWEIFRLCVDGYGPRRIANILTGRNILCPTAYVLSKGYGIAPNLPKNPCQWPSTVVVNILDAWTI